MFLIRGFGQMKYWLKEQQKYKMTIEEYKARNLLKMEVSAQHVASVVAELCSNRFGATTGAQIPIDGGNERTI